MRHKSIELEMGNLPLYLIASLIIMLASSPFHIANIVTAIGTALLLSIKSKSFLEQRRWGIFLGLILGLAPLLTLAGNNFESTRFFQIFYSSLITTIYIGQHFWLNRVKSLSFIFFFIIGFAYLSSLGQGGIIYLQIIFWTLTPSIILPPVIIAGKKILQQKMRFYRITHQADKKKVALV